MDVLNHNNVVSSTACRYSTVQLPILFDAQPVPCWTPHIPQVVSVCRCCCGLLLPDKYCSTLASLCSCHPLLGVYLGRHDSILTTSGILNFCLHIFPIQPATLIHSLYTFSITYPVSTINQHSFLLTRWV